MSNPTWMYRRKGNEIESAVFDSDKLPEGWVDSPAKVDEAAPVKRGPGRPKKTD